MYSTFSLGQPGLIPGFEHRQFHKRKTKPNQKTAMTKTMGTLRELLQGFFTTLLFPFWIIVKAGVYFGLFQNLITGSIGVTVTTMIVAGITGIIIGNLTIGIIGMVIASIGTLELIYGWKNFPLKPPTKGLLTIWGRPYTVGGKDGPTITVSGKTLLAPFFPIFIDAIPVDVTSVEWTFQVKVLSIKRTLPDGTVIPPMPIEGTVYVMATPSEDKLTKYLAASGEMEKIRKRLERIPEQEVQKVINFLPHDGEVGLDALTIFKEKRLISDQLEKGFASDDPVTRQKIGVFGERDLGISCLKIQTDFPIPPKIREAMLEVNTTIYRGQAREIEYAAFLKAINLFEKSGLDPKKAAEAHVTARLIHDGKVNQTQIITKGPDESGTPIPKKERQVS